MKDNDLPHGGSLLIGPIDTELEINIVLASLREHRHLTANVTRDEITEYLQYLKQNRIINGSIDTPMEIEILITMLRKKGILLGPIDTPEEVKLFIDRLRAEGILQPNVNQKNTLSPDTLHKGTIRSKRRINNEMDPPEEDEEKPHP